MEGRTESLRQLDLEGFVLFPAIVDVPEIEGLEAELAELAQNDSKRDPKRRGGLRDLFRASSVRSLCAHERIVSIVRATLGDRARAVRALFFDKGDEQNWQIRWHQDVTIAVAEEREAPGFGPWSTKEGVVHAHAPVTVLESMLALRIHLDDCGPKDGPLRVIPGSHLSGRLSAEDSSALRDSASEHVCLAKRGDVLAMRPLLLHASSKVVRTTRRRVVHIEFAAEPLSDGLRFREEYPIG
ncbi:MAG: phytanoyl-CoA dioxygenase family protein [Planctomycetota bacterium]